MKQYKIKNIAGHLATIFLANPLTPILAFAIILLGYISLEMMPREEDPQIQVSGGSVMVAIPGATPKEIENVIIKPLERRIREIKGVEHIYGTALNNAGMLNVQYYIGQNRESSNLKLYDKVMQHLDQLPKGTLPPLVKPFDIDIDIPILTVAFYKNSDKKLDNIKLYKTIREIQQDINALDNVSKTTLKGAKKPQFNVFIDLQKLSAYHISLGEVAKAIRSISSNAPEIDTTSSTGKLTVFGIKNAVEDIGDLKNLIVAQYMGAPIYLKSIAKIEYSYDVQSFQSVLLTYQNQANKDNKENNKLEFIEAGDQITLTVSKLKGTNAVEIAQEAILELAKHNAVFQEQGVGYIITRNYGDRANEAVNELVHHLVITIFIIAGILIPFLGWRESLVVTIAVPMILALTLFIAYMTDQTINRITLFAFLLSLGLIVDDAIIVIENIHRRMHLPESKGLSFSEVIVQATDEIGPSTNIATIAIMLTMIPMAFVGGMMGQFMTPIPLNVPVALAVSLFVAYVFAPYLAKKLIKFNHHADAQAPIKKVSRKKASSKKRVRQNKEGKS
ncbi:MAG: RND multidrug efflux transporter; Acriflavin resistance protein [uncultured Sulfurovum sp.]|uniref:RND multidrug efflux transporter Acriflavin resistance protein n=1 Tax=uncultured Sulfurovum sp. TaxID=269237 RepID=A0A6S6TYA0_9BACT|nr:MAG: RND multidrug efflux transporter; Acriflavin resistance protein [uncultured Sulfurovum sp.]